MLVRRAFQNRADQTRLETSEEPHRFERDLAQSLQCLRLLIAAEKTLMLAQGVFDFAVLRKTEIVGDAEPRGGLEFRLAIVAKAAFGDQARSFDGDASPALVRAIVRMARMVVSARH